MLVSLPRAGLRPVLDQLSKVWGESYSRIFRYFHGCPKSPVFAQFSLVVPLLLLRLPVGHSQGHQQRPTPPTTERCSPRQQRSVWVSELRVSEAIDLELTALAGMNLAGWSIVGYDTHTTSCGGCLPIEVFLITRTTVVPNEEASGLGTLHLVVSMPETIDAIALLDGVSGGVAELFSWTGSVFAASDGPAMGHTSCNVATAMTAQWLQEGGGGRETASLQLHADPETWELSRPTFGRLNAGMTRPVVGRMIDLTHREVWINEIHYSANGSGDNLRVEIAGLAGVNLAGWWLEYYNGAGSGGGGNCGADHRLGVGGGGGGAGGVGGNGCPSYDRRRGISGNATMPDENSSGFGAVVVDAFDLAHGPISGVALIQPSETTIAGISLSNTAVLNTTRSSRVHVIDFVAFHGERFRATDGSAVFAVSSSTGIPVGGQGASVQLLGGPGWCTWVAGVDSSFGRLNTGQLLAQSRSSVLRLATVVTPGWSGVMDELINRFQQRHQIRVETFSSFDVYEQMERGDADMVISHYKKDDGRTSTRRFVMTGLGHWPKMVMSNTAVIIGPPLAKDGDEQHCSHHRTEPRPCRDQRGKRRSTGDCKDRRCRRALELCPSARE